MSSFSSIPSCPTPQFKFLRYIPSCFLFFRINFILREAMPLNLESSGKCMSNAETLKRICAGHGIFVSTSADAGKLGWMQGFYYLIM
jgi:hypothetical protein